MNKNIIIKSIAALTILTSVTGVGTTVVEGIQQTAKAEHNVKLIKNTNVAPYNGIVSIGSEQDSLSVKYNCYQQACRCRYGNWRTYYCASEW